MLQLFMMSFVWSIFVAFLTPNPVQTNPKIQQMFVRPGRNNPGLIEVGEWFLWFRTEILWFPTDI